MREYAVELRSCAIRVHYESACVAGGSLAVDEMRGWFGVGIGVMSDLETLDARDGRRV